VVATMGSDSYAVIGGTLWGNRGAEAMLVTTIGEVRRRDAEARFFVLSYFPDRDRQLVVDPYVVIGDARPERTLLVHLPFALLAWLGRRLGVRVPDVLLPATVRHLRRCRALFDVSGISFHDGRLAVVAYNLLCLWPALLLGVPVVRLSQAMGPFRNPVNRFLARQVMRHCAHSFVRGRLTAAMVERLDVPAERWTVAGDVAFAYRPSYRITHENEDRVVVLSEELTAVRDEGISIVAVVPSSLVMQKMAAAGGDYVTLLHKLVLHLQSRGKHVLVLPNATRAGEDSLRNNDLITVEALRERARGPGSGIDLRAIHHAAFDVDTASIRQLIEPCELLITSRFHAMVAGLSLCVPTVVMGWSHKYEEVLEMFGCEDDAVGFDSADRELLPLVDRALEQRAARHEQLRERLATVVASAESQFDTAFAHLPE
jgi:colanic acid/amylovoran biosynthesis protein